MKYNVRCCCQPTKILGWMDLPIGHEDTIVTEMVSMAALTTHGAPVQPRTHTVKIKRYREAIENGYWRTEWAIYSENRSIEFWRQVKGFHEAIETNGPVRNWIQSAALVAQADPSEQLVQRPCGFDTQENS
jgi:hypothetical protein